MSNTYFADNRPLYSLTVAEYMQLHVEALGMKQNTNETLDSDREYVYGYDGGAKLFNCSKPTFYRILKSGKIAPAVRQIGRKLIIDKKMALDLIGKPLGGRR